MRLVLALLGLLLVPPALAEARPAGSHSMRAHHAQGRHKHRKHRRHKRGRAKHRRHHKHRSSEF